MFERKPPKPFPTSRKALRVNPASEGALRLMGLAYLEKEDIGKAKSSFQQLLTIDPGLYGQRAQLAELDIKSGDFQSAIDNLQILIDQGVKGPGLHLLLGAAYLGNKDPVEAQGALEKYVGEKPEDARGKYLYGLALNAQGKHAQAEGYFAQALHASPPVKEALAQLVSVCIAEKKLDVALKYVTDQIGAEPKDSRAYLLLGEVRFVRKEKDQAEAAWLKAIEIEPGLIRSPYGTRSALRRKK